ncbi:stage II sporulation protein M [Haloimpatiens sp. FM7330]|uniref:stage II sporulation protein M n=1 Tax=Haloimpatiens sp. FM7330 TaxID=3298610 RepID=UPI0036259EE6
MLSNLQGNLNNHVKQNMWLYLSSIICIFIGMILGVYYVKYMASSDKGNISTYLVSFVNNLENFNIDSKDIFLLAMKNNIPLLIVIWFLGLTIIGLPIILGTNILKGFTLGFSISSLISSLGGKGIWISILGIIPQNIIYIPCIVFVSVVAMEFSLTIIKNRINKQWTTNILQRVASYSFIFLIVFILLFLGYFIEGYLTPNVVKLIV